MQTTMLAEFGSKGTVTVQGCKDAFHAIVNGCKGFGGEVKGGGIDFEVSVRRS